MNGTISINQVYDELKRIEENMITKQELFSLIETLEILGNPKVVKHIAKARQEIKSNKLKEVGSVTDLLKEL
jgi:hypothetical protein